SVLRVCACPRPYPGGITGCEGRSSYPATAAFPDIQAGRLPRHPFRGLLGVHSRYGLHTRQVAPRPPSAPEASTDSLPPPSLRSPVSAGRDRRGAGGDPPPRKTRPFAGRTEYSGLTRSVVLDAPFPTGGYPLMPPPTWRRPHRRSPEHARRPARRGLHLGEKE